MSSVSYASYLSSHTDNPEHAIHIQEIKELCTMIAREEIENYMSNIDSLINEAVSRSINNFTSGAAKAIDVDVNRIVDISCKQLSEQFHSEEVSHFVADTLKQRLKTELGNINVKAIIK